MKACGIDLGTTNSCAYVVGAGQRHLVSDEHGHGTFPSVIWAGRDGRVLVGRAARSHVGQQPAPIVAVKRKMGSTETVALGSKDVTPVEASALILRHIKERAEKQARDEIDRAVVTVPAYFSHVQRQQTHDAATAAGFREVATLLEPVAAALAYSLHSDRDRLRVFVYDLGGGTFDATVLEKDAHGGLTVLSFGGDPHLGGDDADARLAGVLLARLAQRGYSLGLDLARADHRSRFQRLKSYAEWAKVALSEQTEVVLARQRIFEDDDGNTVDLDEVLTRQDLEDCCRDLVDRTMRACQATLNKEGRRIAPESIDEVVMVGGMSRVPLVRQRLAETLGKEPRVVNPDLIVAEGAALKAAAVFAERERLSSGATIELRYDGRTDKDRVSVSGIMDRVFHGHTVYLAQGGDERYQRLDGSDRFTFEGVRLLVGAENTLLLTLEDSQEEPVLRRELKIVQDSRGAVLASPGSVITQPISVWTVDGPHVLFPENTTLPHTASYHFETSDQSGRIVAPIHEANREVARLEIEGLPPGLRVGTSVLIDVAVRADYHIEAQASVPELQRTVRIDFQIDPVDTSLLTPEVTRARLEELEREARAAEARWPTEQEATAFRQRVERIRDEVAGELAEVEPKRVRLQENLSELATLLKCVPPPPRKVRLTPTWQEFADRLSGMVVRAEEHGHPRVAEVGPEIGRLRDRAREAWEGNDVPGWRWVNGQLAALAAILELEVSPRQHALGFAAWLVAVQVPELKAAADGRHLDEIQSIEVAAIAIFVQTELGTMDPEAAIRRLRQLCQEQLFSLRESLGLEEAEPAVVDPARVGDGLVRRARAFE